MDDIVLQLVATNTLTRWPCDICGGSTEKVPTLCEGATPDGELVRCCETCLRAGQDQIDLRLQSHIQQYKPRVTFLRSLLGRVKVPAYADWQAAEQNAWPDDDLPKIEGISLDEADSPQF